MRVKYTGRAGVVGWPPLVGNAGTLLPGDVGVTRGFTVAVKFDCVKGDLPYYPRIANLEPLDDEAAGYLVQQLILEGT